MGEVCNAPVILNITRVSLNNVAVCLLKLAAND